MEKKRINDINIKKVISHSNENSRTIKGYDYMPELYGIACFLARKKSGKTTTLYRILENTVKKGQKIYMFVSTIDIDPTYKKMIKMLTRKGCIVKKFNHFISEDGIDVLRTVMDMIEKPEEDDDKEEYKTIEDMPKSFIVTDNIDNMLNGKKLVKKPIKKKFVLNKTGKDLVCENIFVFDDLASSLRHPTVDKLLCTNRHYLSRVYMCIHYPSQLTPTAISMVDKFFLYPAIDREKIDELGKKCGFTFPEDTKKDTVLYRLYTDATEEKHNFLNIDKGDMIYKKNFNDVYKTN